MNEVEISVVIPAYLEAENLRLLLPRLKNILAKLSSSSEIVVADTLEPKDDTPVVCKEQGVVYLNRQGGNTYGDAVRTGIKNAKGKYIVFMDADGSHDPEFIEKLYAERTAHDVVIASRYVQGGNTDNTFISKLMSLTVNKLFALGLGLPYKDVSNSFKLYNAEQLKNLQLYCNNFDIIEEILYKLKKNKKNLLVKEIPFYFKKRIYGETKRELVKFIFSYARTMFRLRFGNSGNKMTRIPELYSKLKQSSFVRFCIVGTIGVITNLVVFYLTRHYLALSVSLAAVAAFLVAVTQNYYFNHKWTFSFDEQSKPNLFSFIKYAGVNLFSLAVNLIVTNLVLFFAGKGFSESLAQAFGILTGFVLTYVGSSVFIFAKKDNLSLLFKERFVMANRVEYLLKLKNNLFYFFKNEYKVFISFAILFLGLLYLGQVVSVIGNKTILQPVTIEAYNQADQNPESLERFMQLARAGNYTFLKPNLESKQPWTVENVFFKKVLVGMSEKDLKTLKVISVKIGNSDFAYTQDEFLDSWNSVDLNLLKGNLSGKEDVDFKLFESPEALSLPKSHIPVYKSFFGSIINWGGDSTLFLKPLKNALGAWVLVLFLTIFIRVVYLIVRNSSFLESHEQEELRKYIAFSLSIYTSVFCLLLLNIFLKLFYKPNTAGILSQAKLDYVNYFFKSIRPKPVERLQFVLSTVLSPFLVYFSYLWFEKKNFFSKALYKVLFFFNLFLFASVIYLGLAVSGFFFVRDSFFAGFYFRYVYALILFPLCFVFLYYKNPPKSVLLFLKLLGLLAVVTVFSLGIVNLFDGYLPLDLDPVIYPQIQVLSGKNLLAPVTSFYGLYAFFLQPIFQLIGFSVLKFSLVMSSLMLLSFWFLKKMLRRAVENTTIYLLGFLAIVFYTVLATRTMPEYYFQYWPIRFIFPALGFYLITWYLKNKSQLAYFFGILLSAIGVLWNLDVGLVLFLSFLATLVLDAWSNRQSFKEFFKASFLHLLYGGLALILIISFFAIVTHFQSGMWPDLALLLRYQKLFVAGYLNIPMVPPPHTWAIILLVYLIGLLSVAKALAKNEVNYTSKIIFFSCILGLGLFAYYEGQSSDITLFRTSYPAIIVITIFADRLWSELKTHGQLIFGKFVILAFLLFILFSAPFSIIRNLRTYYNFASQAVKNIQLKDSGYLRNVSFIKQNTQANEKVFILASPQQGVYYAQSKTWPAVTVASVADIVFKKDLDTQADFLQNNKNLKVFAVLPLENYDKFDPRLKKIIMEQYKQVLKSEDGMVYFLPK